VCGRPEKPEAVEELQRQVNDLQTTIADLNLRMEEMNSSLFVLRETAKNNHEAIKKLQEELQQPTVYIQEPSSHTVTQSEPVMMPAPTAETTPAPLPVGGGGTRENEDAAFGKAMVQMQQSNWGLAVYDLNAFIAQHPGRLTCRARVMRWARRTATCRSSRRRSTSTSAVSRRGRRPAVCAARLVLDGRLLRPAGTDRECPTDARSSVA
jgi:hypothetical protein